MSNPENHSSKFSRSPSRSHYDVVIVGGGHNGLIAAAYLGRAGKSVLVLERNESVGGASISAQLFPDYDVWVSRYAYLISLLPSQIVDELQLDFATRRRTTASFTPYTDKSGKSRGLVVSNVNPERSRDSFRELTGDLNDWEGYQRLLELEQSLAGVVWPSLLQPLRTKDDFIRQLETPLQREAWDSFVERPLGEVIERTIAHDLVRGLVMTDGKIGVFTHPHDPSLIQNRCFLYHVIGGGTGEWRVPVGGMKSFVNALVQDCQKHGVEIVTHAPVSHVNANDAQPAVVFHDGTRDQTIGCSDVLVNASPSAFAKIMGTELKTQPTDEGSVIKMNMLLRRLPRVKATGVSSVEAFCGSFHIDEGYEQMQVAQALAAQSKMPDPIPCEIYCHTLTDDSIMAPELCESGFHTLTLFALDMPYRLFATNHDEQKEIAKQKLLDGLNRVCEESFEDCLARDRDGKLCLEIKTPQDLEQEVGLDLGNIFHNSLSWFFAEEDSQVGTWGVETEFPHVLLAGSSAQRGGAVSGIPGRNAAMSLLQSNK